MECEVDTVRFVWLGVGMEPVAVSDSDITLLSVSLNPRVRVWDRLGVGVGGGVMVTVMVTDGVPASDFVGGSVPGGRVLDTDWEADAEAEILCVDRDSHSVGVGEKNVEVGVRVRYGGGGGGGGVGFQVRMNLPLPPSLTRYVFSQ